MQSFVCREDSFTASQRNASPLKAEDHRHLFAKPQRSASVPPPQRQMLDEYRESSLGMLLLDLSAIGMLASVCSGRRMSCTYTRLSLISACHARFR